MNKFRIFLAAPMSGCSSESEYQAVRAGVMNLIRALRVNGHKVLSELEDVAGTVGYDSPGTSVLLDFNHIRSSDVFLLFHPRKMQTSALIELGFAYAHDKTIIMVSPSGALPYMALGFPEVNPQIRIIESGTLDEKTISQIIGILD